MTVLRSSRTLMFGCSSFSLFLRAMVFVMCRVNGVLISSTNEHHSERKSWPC